jgi:HNH endonuclease
VKAEMRPASDYRLDPETGCWVWQKSLTPTGYPRVCVNNGPNRRAHRVYFEMHKGPVPSGCEVHHTCGNRLCVNPEHLEALTGQEHRARHGKSSHLGVYWVGEKNCWKVRVKRQGVRSYLPGQFKTEADAVAALERAGGYER